MENFQFDEFYVELKVGLNPDGFMGLANIRKVYREIRYAMHFKTDMPLEKCKAFADFIEETCPSGNTLANGVKLVRTMGVKDRYETMLPKG